MNDDAKHRPRRPVLFVLVVLGVAVATGLETSLLLNIMERKEEQPAWGCRAISKIIGRTERQTFHLLEGGHLPARKVGKRAGVPVVPEVVQTMYLPRYGLPRFSKFAMYWLTSAFRTEGSVTTRSKCSISSTLVTGDNWRMSAITSGRLRYLSA